VQQLLKPGGFYFLLIPDKRYCFDHFIPKSNLAQVIAASIEERTQYSLRTIIENFSLKTHNNHKKHWQGDHGEIYSSMKEKVENAISEYKKTRGPCVNIHVWYFIPDAFKKIILALNELSYIQLNTERVYPTLYGKNEFWVILKKS
jgi:hypothetical protein